MARCRDNDARWDLNKCNTPFSDSIILLDTLHPTVFLIRFARAALNKQQTHVPGIASAFICRHLVQGSDPRKHLIDGIQSGQDSSRHSELPVHVVSLARKIDRHRGVGSGARGRWSGKQRGGANGTTHSAPATAVAAAVGAAMLAVEAPRPSALDWERGLQLLEATHPMAAGAARERLIAHANRLLGLP
eukprot:SAG22_NODE_99_length_20560_cov_128.669029_22_plen_189_part_00